MKKFAVNITLMTAVTVLTAAVIVADMAGVKGFEGQALIWLGAGYLALSVAYTLVKLICRRKIFLLTLALTLTVGITLTAAYYMPSGLADAWPLFLSGCAFVPVVSYVFYGATPFLLRAGGYFIVLISALMIGTVTDCWWLAAIIIAALAAIALASEYKRPYRDNYTMPMLSIYDAGGDQETDV